MEYELPTEFDIIIVGTGIVESVVSAAASRVGKTVLHIDSQDYYGGLWASFNLEQIEKFGGKTQIVGTNISSDVKLSDGERLLPIGNDLFDLQNVSLKWNVPEKVESKSTSENVTDKGDAEGGDNSCDAEKEADNGLGDADVWTQEKLLKESRKFNIDIAPKLQFARGDFVELLISSNIARYSEYRSVSRVLTWLNDRLEIVPCSRSDVFSNPKVTVIEKRMLMKLLNGCMDSEENEFKGYEDKTFHTYLKDKKLTDNLIHYVLYAIGMSTIDTPCLDGVENIKRFLGSLGRFGKTPFLYSMYGSGELSQAFCRLSAVFGGVYALNQTLGGFIFDENEKFKGLVCGKQIIKAPHLVVGVEKSPVDFLKSLQRSYISRGIFVTNGSIMASEKEHLTLLFYPLKSGKSLCKVIELGALTGTCPKGIYIVHMFTKQINTPKEDLEECVSKLFQSEKEDSDMKDNRPAVLWSFYYSAPDVNEVDLRQGVPENVFLCPGPDCDLDMDLSIKKAKEIFNSIYPGEEFLPRAPDPEEIIIGEEPSEEQTDNGNNIQNEYDKQEEQDDFTEKHEEKEEGGEEIDLKAQGDTNN